jgi:hypothetical protein
MVVARHSGGRGRWRRRRIHVFDGKEVCGFAEGEEGSFDGGAGERCCDFDAEIGLELEPLFEGEYAL